MALRKTVVFRGLAVPDAYVRIYNLSGKVSVGIFVSLHVTPEQDAFDTREYNFFPDHERPIMRQAYDFLKRQEEFEGAVDVMEAGEGD